MTHTTQYLYGIEPGQLAELLYFDALHFKINSAKGLLKQLIQPPYLEWDHQRVNAIHKAIKFNTELLKELA